MTTAAERRRMERRNEMRDNASLVISAASLAVGLTALCLNEKPGKAQNTNGAEKMSTTRGCSERCKNANCGSCKSRSCNVGGSANRKKAPTRSCNATVSKESADVRIARAKADKKAAVKEKKANRTAAQAARQGQKALKLSKQQQIRAYAKEIGYTGKVILPNEKPKTSRAWVAMEYNTRTGGDRQAIVCGSRDEAQRRAISMRDSHTSGSQRARDCIQGYVRVDTSKPIDIIGCFESGSVTEVRSCSEEGPSPPTGRAAGRLSPPARAMTGCTRWPPTAHQASSASRRYGSRRPTATSMRYRWTRKPAPCRSSTSTRVSSMSHPAGGRGGGTRTSISASMRTGYSRSRSPDGRPSSSSRADGGSTPTSATSWA